MEDEFCYSKLKILGRNHSIILNVFTVLYYKFYNLLLNTLYTDGLDEYL